MTLITQLVDACFPAPQDGLKDWVAEAVNSLNQTLQVRRFGGYKDRILIVNISLLLLTKCLYVLSLCF